MDICFFKNGFPANFKFKNKNHDANINSVNSKDSATTSSGNCKSNMILTNEEYATLADMIKKVKLEIGDYSINSLTHNTSAHHVSKGNFLNSFWIIDSGATDHVCNDLSFFETYNSIPPISVNLPNGERSKAFFFWYCSF